MDKIKVLLEDIVQYLQHGIHSLEDIQAKFDEITLAINDLEDKFDQHYSEIESVARIVLQKQSWGYCKHTASSLI